MNTIPDAVRFFRSATPLKGFISAVAFAIVALVPFGGIRAGDNPVYSYEGRISGVYCSACSAKVESALGKMAGVTKVKIISGEELGVQLLQVKSTVASLTKETAIAALGESAKEYSIQELKLKQ